MMVIIIGNGIAGFSAGSSLRNLDRHCQITMISAESSPLYSRCVLPDYISGEIPRGRVFIKSEKDYADLGIHTRWGREVMEIDTTIRRVVMDDGGRLSYDKLILATGSDAIVMGDLKTGVFKFRTLGDAEGILNHRGKKAIVVGSGVNGVKIGIALHRRGYKVTLLARRDQILRLGLDLKGADKVKAILEDHGIEILNNEWSEKILGNDRVEGLLTNKRELACDTLIWAVGMRPTVELAKRAGIVVGNKGGIKVSSRMETNIRDVYACGDCIESNDILTGKPNLHLFWYNANCQGLVVARNCAGLATEYRGAQYKLNMDVFGNHVAAFGFTEAALYLSKDVRALGGEVSEISIIEKDKNGTYYRLVMVGDRCVGGQFINTRQMSQGIGLIWSYMAQRRSIKELLRVLENDEFMRHKPWAHRLKPFFT
jgi:NADH oxidase (H2O2-forming)